MLRYKIDPLAELIARGYTTYRLEKEGLIYARAIQSLRSGEMVSVRMLGIICTLLDIQPGDLLENVPDELECDPDE